MICDPLTKAGTKGFASRLQHCMESGELSLEPTVESQMKKLKTQKARQAKALAKETVQQPSVEFENKWNFAESEALSDE